jgi:hypothetical protein
MFGGSPAALSRIRSVAGANPRRGGADAADAEPAEDGVAPRRGIRRPGQIGSERAHVAASRVGEIDLGNRRVRLSGGGADKAEQGNRRRDNAHRYGSPSLRTIVARAMTHGNQLD